jgi:hypothetical protein
MTATTTSTTIGKNEYGHPTRQQPNAKSQYGSGDYNCVGLQRKQHRTTSPFLVSEMREGMQRSDTEARTGSRAGWENGRTTNLPVRVSFTVRGYADADVEAKQVQMPQIPVNSGRG